MRHALATTLALPLLLAPLPALAQEAPATATATTTTGPTPAPTPSQRTDCGVIQGSLPDGDAAPLANDPARITLFPEFGPGRGFDLTRISPGPVAVVRSDTHTVETRDSTFWILILPETTVLRARMYGRGEGCADSSFTYTQPVRARVAIAAFRTATRVYTFSGRVTPARGQTVTLYRHDGSRKIIAAQTTVQVNGTYRIDRRFTGSGRISFSTAVKDSASSLGNSSAVRPTVVH